MTPEESFKKLESSTTIPYDVAEAFRVRLIPKLPKKLKNAPISAITAPSGGTTVDSQARTAINSIITALEQLGLLEEN